MDSANTLRKNNVLGMPSPANAQNIKPSGSQFPSPANSQAQNSLPQKNHVFRGTLAPSENSEYSEQELRNSKSASIKDGGFWAVMFGAGEEYISPFAIRLGADSAFSGIIQTVPLFLGSISQLIALPLEQKIKNRKLTISIIIFLQALVWVFLALIALAANPMPGSNSSALFLVFILFSLYQVFGQVANPIWSSWMAELVHMGQRGEYFAKRSTIIVFVQLLSILGAGWLLSNLSLPVFQIFAILFIIAFLARAISDYFLSTMSDKPHKSQHEFGSSPFSDWKTFLASPANAEGRRFTLYITALMSSVYIASPFFDIYMLKVLNFDYFTWSLVITVQTLVKFLTFSYWGKVIDRFGNRAVLFGTGFLVSGVALFWVLSSDLSWILIAQIFSGAAWSGFELACFNYAISSPERSSRTALAAAYNFAKGTGALLGTIAGAIFLSLWHFFGTFGAGSFLALFFLSSLCRYIASFYFLPKFSQKTFEGGMDGKQFLWQVIAVQPTHQLSGYLGQISGASIRLATIGVEKTKRAAVKLGEHASKIRRRH